MILALDCETSALPANGIKIGSVQYPWPVSLAAVMFDFNGRNLGLSHSLIKAAGRKISVEATKIHGITDRMSESFGSDEKIELAELCERTAKVRYVTGYNLQFDLGIIQSALLRLEMTNSYRKLFRPGISVRGSDAAICGLLQARWRRSGRRLSLADARRRDVHDPRLQASWRSPRRAP